MTETNVQVRDGPTAQSATWLLPPEGWMKINTDGAFDAREMTGATGAVVRGPDGVFLVAGSRWLPSVASALMAEAEACRDGVRLVAPGEQRPVVLETDSLELVNVWNSLGKHRSEVSVILEDIQDIASSFRPSRCGIQEELLT